MWRNGLLLVFLLPVLVKVLCASSTAVYHSASSVSIQVEDSWRTDTVQNLNHGPALHISRSSQGHHESEKHHLCEIEVRRVSRSMSRRQSASVLCGFDWCVYLNPLHRPHRPEEAGGHLISNSLRSHRHGVTPIRLRLVNTCMHRHTLHLILSLRSVAYFRLIIRLWWYCMWNRKISGCVKRWAELREIDSPIKFLV